MTEFLLTEGFLSGTVIEIDEERFNELLHAKNVIKPIWEVEDTFSLLANAFIEFEEQLLSAGMRYVYQRDMQRDVDHFFDDVRQNVNLKLISVLTASRVYEEQLLRRTSSLSKLIGKVIDLNGSFSSVFDSSLEYRVMYALRNHALHNQLPLGGITFSNSNLSSTGDIRDDAPTRHRVTVDPRISVEEFCNSDKLRELTRKEVEDLGCEYLDLKFFARGFVSCLAHCHSDFRTATEAVLEKSLSALQTAYNELQKAKGEVPTHASIVRRINGRKVEDHYIDYSKKSRIRDVRKFWTGLQWLQRAYVSSEVRQSKNTYPNQHEDIWIAK